MLIKKGDKKDDTIIKKYVSCLLVSIIIRIDALKAYLIAAAAHKIHYYVHAPLKSNSGDILRYCLVKSVIT